MTKPKDNGLLKVNRDTPYTLQLSSTVNTSLVKGERLGCIIELASLADQLREVFMLISFRVPCNVASCIPILGYWLPGSE